MNIWEQICWRFLEGSVAVHPDDNYSYRRDGRRQIEIHGDNTGVQLSFGRLCWLCCRVYVMLVWCSFLHCHAHFRITALSFLNWTCSSLGVFLIFPHAVLGLFIPMPLGVLLSSPFVWVSPLHLLKGRYYRQIIVSWPGLLELGVYCLDNRQLWKTKFEITLEFLHQIYCIPMRPW